MGSNGSNLGGQIDIESVVREVLRRILAASETTKPAPTAKPENSLATASDVLRVPVKVVSVAELDGRLSGVRQVVFSKGAVVTPAARDLLRQKRIAITYAAGKSGKESHRLTIGVAESKYQAAALARALGQAGVEVEQLASTGLTSVVDEISNQVSTGGQFGLLLSDQAAAAACLANRQRGVRAAVAKSVREVESIVGTLGCNLLAIDPTGPSFSELLRMTRTFIHAERHCRPELLARLS